MKLLDKWIISNVEDELRKIKPEMVQNDFGTRVIDRKELAVWRHIAHLRILTQMSGFIFFMEWFFIFGIIVYLMRKHG